MIYKYVINIHVRKIILNIYDYERGLGYNTYNESPLVIKILPVWVIWLNRLRWGIGKIILGLSAEKAKDGPDYIKSVLCRTKSLLTTDKRARVRISVRFLKFSIFPKQAKFSMVDLPYSLKLLLAPLIDTLYSRQFGKRKTWLVPIQCCLGAYHTGWIFIFSRHQLRC
jgi:hypothetical protein